MDESTKEATEGWRWFSRDFVLGQERPEHRHADAQLLYAMRGVMLVKSGTVRRIITPNQALWIPGGNAARDSFSVENRDAYALLCKSAGAHACVAYPLHYAAHQGADGNTVS
ncbi:MAG: hypothetical protein V8R49_03735 [Duodenibacillus massiliensis]